jgi:hypothetical protein
MKTLREIESCLREISTDLWSMTVDNPETATVQSEEAGMTPRRRKLREAHCDIDKAADAVESVLWRTVPTMPEGFTRCGLNGDWNCDAWHVGPSTNANERGGDLYLLDNEEGGWIVVRRWYVEGDYQGLPSGYSAYSDGANDAIVELLETQNLGVATSFCRALSSALDCEAKQAVNHDDGYTPTKDGDPCADCLAPVWYCEDEGQWFHTDPDHTCFLASGKAQKAIVRCSDCGGTNVMCHDWIDPNADTVLGCLDSTWESLARHGQSYCDDCNEHTVFTTENPIPTKEN